MSKCVKFQDSYFENHPSNAKMSQSNFCCFIIWIFYELRYTVITQIVWTFYLKSVPAKFQKIFKTYFMSYQRDKFVKTVMQPLVIPPGTSVATIVTICCNHRDGEYFLHQITRKLGSTATSTVITRLSPLANYISDAENETKRALLGHTNGNIEMRSPSATAMLTMVAVATIVRFPPVDSKNTVHMTPIFVKIKHLFQT